MRRPILWVWISVFVNLTFFTKHLLLQQVDLGLKKEVWFAAWIDSDYDQWTTTALGTSAFGTE